ncbi:hypothetical protein JCM10213_008582 [Rhodosporidiobolus nylandii]
MSPSPNSPPPSGTAPAAPLDAVKNAVASTDITTPLSSTNQAESASLAQAGSAPASAAGPSSHDSLTTLFCTTLPLYLGRAVLFFFFVYHALPLSVLVLRATVRLALSLCRLVLFVVLAVLGAAFSLDLLLQTAVLGGAVWLGAAMSSGGVGSGTSAAREKLAKAAGSLKLLAEHYGVRVGSLSNAVREGYRCFARAYALSQSPNVSAASLSPAEPSAPGAALATA